MSRSGRLAGAAALGVAALAGCVPADPAPVWVGDLPLDSGPCEPEVYPCGAQGTAPCSQIADLSFVPANAQAEAVAGEPGLLSLHDLYADQSVAGLLLFGTAGWCQYCSQEGEWLISVYEDFQAPGRAGGRVEFVAVVFQDEYSQPATPEYAEGYAARRGFPFPAVADRGSGFLDLFEPTEAPGNIFVNRGDMVIQQILQGFDQTPVELGLRALDGTTGCQ